MVGQAEAVALVIALMWGRQLQTLIERSSRMEGKLMAAEDATARLQGEIADLREQNVFLLRSMLDMKREGFNPAGLWAHFGQDAAEQEEELPEEVMNAILARSEEGTDLYGELVKDAWLMLKKEGLDPARAAALTLRGGAVLEDSWQS